MLLAMGKIIHLTSVHGRYDVRIFNKECRSIAAHGDDVTLVVQDGKGDETRDGVQIHDLGLLPAGRIRRVFISPWRAYRSLRHVPAAIIHFHDPELLPAGFFLKKCRHQVIYDSHEDVPRDILSKHWIPVALRRVLSFFFEMLENFIVKRLDAVVAATPFIAERFRRIQTHSVAINNFPLPDEFTPAAKDRPFSRTVCYAGVITRMRGITELLEALDLLRDVTLVLCGPFESKAFGEELRSTAGWRHVDYRGVVARNEVGAIMAGSEIGILVLLPSPNHVNSQPNKMFEYMASGLPLLASDFPLWRQMIEEARCGVCVDPSSPAEIAGGIAGLLSDKDMCRAKGRAGKKAIAERFNWPHEAEKLIRLYEEMA